MPNVPERPISRGELFNQRKMKRIKKVNKSNHAQQKRVQKSKARAKKKYIAEFKKYPNKEFGYNVMLDKLKNLL